MPKIDRAAILFSVNCFAAAMLALYIALAIGLPRPYWAMTTAYIVSHPLSGAVRSKALYRVFGTVLGAVAAVALVPTLVNAPVLLGLALALWVGACLAISLLDRTPRSYVVMLAGYSAAIIGFPSVAQPDAIFDVAVARVVEIGLGILCAALVHSVVFPRSVGDVLTARLKAWLADADRWALDLLQGADLTQAARDRRHLAGAASEIRVLATHLPFDTSRLAETAATVRALQDRMLLLIPVLSGLSDRLAALRVGEEQPEPEVQKAMGAVAAWIGTGADRPGAPALVEHLRRLRTARRAEDWRALLSLSLLERLSDLVPALDESHALLAHLGAAPSGLPPDLAAAVETAGRRPMHRDLGMALLSGAAATVAVALCCGLWIQTGWAEGAVAAMMAGVFCSFFATMDDPSPAIVNFGLYTLLSLPISALYSFAVLPGIDGFPMLVAVLAPPLLLFGAVIADPKWMMAGLALAIGFCNAIALQESFSTDFAGFMNFNLAQFVGLFVALTVTQLMRTISVDAGARRLVRQTRRDLAALARASRAPEPAAFAGRLVDRVGLLTPKLAAGDAGRDPVGADGMRDLRVGMNIVALQQARPGLPAHARSAVTDLLAGVGEHYARRPDHAPPPALLTKLDGLLAEVADCADTAASSAAGGLTGLRRNLFPTAPAFAPDRLEGCP